MGTDLLGYKRCLNFSQSYIDVDNAREQIIQGKIAGNVVADGTLVLHGARIVNIQETFDALNVLRAGPEEATATLVLLPDTPYVKVNQPTHVVVKHEPCNLWDGTNPASFVSSFAVAHDFMTSDPFVKFIEDIDGERCTIYGDMRDTKTYDRVGYPTDGVMISAGPIMLCDRGMHTSFPNEAMEWESGSGEGGFEHVAISGKVIRGKNKLCAQVMEFSSRNERIRTMLRNEETLLTFDGSPLIRFDLTEFTRVDPRIALTSGTLYESWRSDAIKSLNNASWIVRGGISRKLQENARGRIEAIEAFVIAWKNLHSLRDEDSRDAVGGVIYDAYRSAYEKAPLVGKDGETVADFDEFLRRCSVRSSLAEQEAS